MNRHELHRAITAAGKDARFSIRDEPDPDSLPDFTTVMEPEVDRSGWTVFYVERLEKDDVHHFDTEAEACDYVNGLIDRV